MCVRWRRCVCVCVALFPKLTPTVRPPCSWGRHIPDKDGALRADRDDGLLIGRDLDRRDGPRVTRANGVRDAVVVVPRLDRLVGRARDEEGAPGLDVERGHLGLAAVDDADRRAVVRVPVRDLVVGAAREDLRLVGMVE